MKAELRKNRNGTEYYSFVYYDNQLKKTKRISKKEIQKRFGRDITDHEKAMEACRLLEAEIDSLKNRIKTRVEWEEEFYQFEKLLATYELQQKKKAPNSYKNNVHYLKYYVLPFFLTLKKCNNISQWFDYYAEFKNWLEEDARLIMNPKQKISYASKNHAIKALNTFVHSLYKQGILDKYFTCECFPEHLLTQKGVNDLISLEEMEILYKQLIDMGAKKEAIFFRCLYFTGMRFNEALGLHPGNLYDGQIERQDLTKQLKQGNISYFGYCVIDSQPSHKARNLRDEKGTITHKPLKGQKRIDEKSARTVIITDKILWNELVELHNNTLKQYKCNSYGMDIKQYPIFEGINRGTATTRLKKAYELSNLPYRSWHCCRHTRATFLIGETGSNVLAKLWLGHSTDKILNRYVHVYEAITRSAKKKRTNGSFRDLKTQE